MSRRKSGPASPAAVIAAYRAKGVEVVEHGGRGESAAAGQLGYTEKAFMADVIALARLFGWLVYHTHDSRRSEAGYPDLTMLRAGRVVVAELKADKGKLTEAQRRWLDAFDAARVPAFVWRPVDWPDIRKTLGNT